MSILVVSLINTAQSLDGVVLAPYDQQIRGTVTPDITAARDLRKLYYGSVAEDATTTVEAGDVVSDLVLPINHISNVLHGADIIRRTRPDATYSTARYCTPAGAGAHDGTSMANAWSLSELVTALAVAGGNLNNTHVYLSGTFEPASSTSAGPLLKVETDNVRLDFATYSAVMRGYSALTWTASGVNGEFYTTASATQAWFRITENGARMRGVSGKDCSARMQVSALDASADTITLPVYRTLAVNDLIAWLGGTANGLSSGTIYYVKTATALSSGSQTITLSTSPGGATVDITGTLSGSKYMWSLVGGRDGDPVPGSLQPGQYAYAPQESRIYIRPTTGVPGDHVYTLWMTGTNPYFVQVSPYPTAGSADNCEVIGGEFYGAPAYGIVLGASLAAASCVSPRVYGVVVHACESGIVATGAADADIAWNHAYDLSDHAIGSKDGSNAEPRMQLRENWVHDLARQPWDMGDCQALVTNPLSDDVLIRDNVAQRVGHLRDLDAHPIGPNDNVNTGTIVVDSSKRLRIIGNYLEECYGESIELGPNDYQAITEVVVAGNVLDNRRCLAALQDTNDAAMTPKIISISISSSSTYGLDYSNIIEGNLVLVDDVRRMNNSSFTHGIIALRNAKNAGDVECRLTVRNNVVLFLHPTADWSFVSIRHSSTAAGNATGVRCDGNVFYSANPALSGVWRLANTVATNSATPTATVPLANMGNGIGWSGMGGSGEVNDKHSEVWSLAKLAANFSTHPTVMRCLSV